MINDMPTSDYCLFRSYMYRRMGLPRQSYMLRRMAARARARGW